MNEYDGGEVEKLSAKWRVLWWFFVLPICAASLALLVVDGVITSHIDAPDVSAVGVRNLVVVSRLEGGRTNYESYYSNSRPSSEVVQFGKWTMLCVETPLDEPQCFHSEYWATRYRQPLLAAPY